MYSYRMDTDMIAVFVAEAWSHYAFSAGGRKNNEMEIWPSKECLQMEEGMMLLAVSLSP